MKETKKLWLAAFVIAAIFSLNSCDKKEDTTTDNLPTEGNTVQLSVSTSLGKILTDSKGMTLYFFSKDTQGTSVCVDGCLDIWPIFYAENLTLDAGLDTNDFGTITRADGNKQTTYKGWPLYYFANDANAGDTNGENVNNVWFVAKPDYSLMYGKAQLVGHDGQNYKSDYTVGTEETFYITDINGRTLYTFKKDSKDQNTFTAADFSNNGVWPIAEITLDKIPSLLSVSDFGTINVHGRTQLTYKGWPLYYFGQDTQRGNNKGVSFPSPGVWPIANTGTTNAQ